MLGLNEEERAFADSVGRYLDERYGLHQREVFLESGPYSKNHWGEFADLGWLASVFDEDSGGFGNAANYAGILMEQFGRRLVVEPLLTTAIVCGRILASVGGQADAVDRLIGGGLQLSLLNEWEAVTSGSQSLAVERYGEVLAISGRWTAVLNAAAADLLILVALVDQSPILLLIPTQRDGVIVESLRGHDGHNLGNVIFNSVIVEPTDILASGTNATDAVELALDWGAAALCAEAVGSMGALFDATRTHLKTRVQYDHPLADFQVLQHRVADMFIQLETSRSIAYGALASLDGRPERRKRLVSAAKIYVFRAANFVGKQAVQLHGAMGVSEELDVAHHFKRLTMAALQFGHERRHLRRFLGQSTWRNGIEQEQRNDP